MLINALKNYYHCFLYSEHSVNRYKNGIFTRMFKKSIIAFYNYNKIFGRLIYSCHHNNIPNFISHYLEFKNVHNYIKEQEISDYYEPDAIRNNELNIINDIPAQSFIFNPRNIINEIINNNQNIIEDMHNDDNSISSSSSIVDLDIDMEEINDNNNMLIYATSSDEEKENDDDMH